MRLNRLQLYDFRSFPTLDLTLTGQVNVFVGGNAEGKTNILEAVHLLATGRSHRANRDRELVRWGATTYLVRGHFQRRGGPLNVDVGFSADGHKVLRLNGLVKRRLSEIIGQARVVLFAPEDLALVKGSPEVRRHYLDLQLSQVSPAYYHHLASYHRVLEQRNRLLKNGPRAEGQGLSVWDDQLIAHGLAVMQRRREALQRLMVWTAEAHRRLSGGQEELSGNYLSSILEAGSGGPGRPDQVWDEEALRTAFQRRLERLRPLELQRGTTLAGPHRDDFELKINDREARLFASQGQQRTVALALKLAEVEFLTEDGDPPILLLDDVLSELDERRQTFLLDIVGRVQTIITGTDASALASRLAADVAFYKVIRGAVTPAGGGQSR